MPAPEQDKASIFSPATSFPISHPDLSNKSDNPKIGIGSLAPPPARRLELAIRYTTSESLAAAVHNIRYLLARFDLKVPTRTVLFWNENLFGFIPFEVLFFA